MSRVRARGKWGKGWRPTKLAVHLRRDGGDPRVRLQWGRVAVELTPDRARRVADILHDTVDEAETPPESHLSDTKPLTGTGPHATQSNPSAGNLSAENNEQEEP